MILAAVSESKNPVVSSSQSDVGNCPLLDGYFAFAVANIHCAFPRVPDV